MKKKTISLLLILVMVLTIFTLTGCSKERTYIIEYEEGTIVTVADHSESLTVTADENEIEVVVKKNGTYYIDIDIEGAGSAIITLQFKNGDVSCTETSGLSYTISSVK